MVYYGYCEDHFIVYDSNTGSCPICKLNRRCHDLEDEIIRMQDIFDNAKDLFGKILKVVSESNGKLS